MNFFKFYMLNVLVIVWFLFESRVKFKFFLFVNFGKCLMGFGLMLSILIFLVINFFLLLCSFWV